MSQPSSPAQPQEEFAQLAARLGTGDVRALAEVIRTLGPRIAAGLARRHPRLRAEDIEDVLSIASHRLWESRAQFDPSRGSLGAWFFIIADNAAKDVLKKAARQLEQPVDMTQFCSLNTTPRREDTAGSAVQQELDEILLGLPPLDQRIISAFAQAGGGGAWAADLSRELGMRAGTIRVRCQRIKERIRRAMHARGTIASADAV